MKCEFKDKLCPNIYECNYCKLKMTYDYKNDRLKLLVDYIKYLGDIKNMTTPKGWGKKPKGKGWIKIAPNRWRRLNKTSHWVKVKGKKGILTSKEIQRATKRVKKFLTPKRK